MSDAKTIDGSGPRRPRWFRNLLLLVSGYFFVAAVTHYWIVPQNPPGPSTMPEVGERLIGRVERVEQVILKIEEGQAYTRTTFFAGSGGPPIHWHQGFDEEFHVTDGTLHVWHEGEVHELTAGESYRVAAGERHQPFNPTNDPVVIMSLDQPAFPVEFAGCLSQIYGYMDEHGVGPGMLAQIAVFSGRCDTHVMPGFIEPVINALVAPTARLFGYSNHYSKYETH